MPAINIPKPVKLTTWLLPMFFALLIFVQEYIGPRSGDRVEWLKSTAYRKMLLLFWELCEEHAAKKQQQIPKKILQITVEVKRILRFSVFIIPSLPFTSDIPQFCKHVLLSFYYN